ADLVGVATVVGVPHVAVSTLRDPGWTATHAPLGEGAARRDPANLAAGVFGEPQIVVRPQGDILQPATGRRHRVQREAAARGGIPDLVGVGQGEPQTAVGAQRRGDVRVAGRLARVVVGDGAARGTFGHRLITRHGLGKPQVAVGPGDDVERRRVVGVQAVFVEGARGIDLADLVGAVFGEPDQAV